jgi:hypothetical protein
MKYESDEWSPSTFNLIKKLFILTRIPERNRTDEDRTFLTEVQSLIIERGQKENAHEREQRDSEGVRDLPDT